MQNNDVWYLGIDFGTTGISAVLLNATDGEQYPIYWSTPTSSGDWESSFRLPCIAYSGMTNGNSAEQSPLASLTVGSLAANMKSDRAGVLIQKFKPYLKTGIPYYSGQTNSWEPWLQWSNQQSVSLYWILRALQALLATLKPSKEAQTLLKVGAIDLSNEALNVAMSNLSGVVLGDPVDWGDTYRFNLREAVLGAGLVKSPEQIFFIEDAIATVLSWLDQKQQIKIRNQDSGALQLASAKFSASSFQKGVLIINAGATTTEMAVVDLPDDLQRLTHRDFITRSFPYGGNSIDQDIIYQMFLRNQGTATGGSGLSVLGLGADLQMSEQLFAGEPDLKTRYFFQQLLQSSPLGGALLKAATHLKLILQNQDQFVFNLGEQKLVCTRTDLQKRVVLPFIEKLNREINALLSHTRIGDQGISHVICTGGTSALAEIGEWLQQKFINAVIIHDNYQNGGLKNCSRVAHGLASLPLYPQVLERQEQQYSDYFLLLELLNVFPDKATSLTEIMQLLERRGINTRACKERLLGFLEGKLPKGLVLDRDESSCLTQGSRQNSEYQAIAAAPLFSKQAGQLYYPNLDQYQYLRQYLNVVLSGTYQKLQEPLILDLGVPCATV